MINDIKNIKIITHISHRFDSRSPKDLVTNISADLEPVIRSFPEKSRIRLYTYFIYETSRYDKAVKSKSSKQISRKNATVLTFLSPGIREINKLLTEYNSTFSAGPKKPSVQLAVERFCLSFNDKLSRLSNPQYESDDTRAFTYPESYNKIITDVIQTVENNSSYILMPAFDPKIINSKHLPKDLLVETNMVTLFVNTKKDAHLFQHISKPKIASSTANTISSEKEVSTPEVKSEPINTESEIKPEPIVESEVKSKPINKSEVKPDANAESEKRLKQIQALKDIS